MKFCLSKNNKAFTLAEIIVVITLLGVLAAIIIPSTIKNHKKKVTVVKVKKAYSILNSAATNLQFSTDCSDVTCAVDKMVNGKEGYEFVSGVDEDNRPIPDSYVVKGATDFNSIINEYIGFKTSEIVDTSKLDQNKNNGIYILDSANGNTYHQLEHCESNDDCKAYGYSQRPSTLIGTHDGIFYNFYPVRAAIDKSKGYLVQAILVEVYTDNINKNPKLVFGRNVFNFLIYGNFNVQTPYISSWGQISYPGSAGDAPIENWGAYSNNPDGMYYKECVKGSKYSPPGWSCAYNIIYDGNINY